MRGTSARCGCGAVIQIPAGPAAAAPASSPFGASGGPAPANPYAAPSPPSSILDELTARDIQGPAAAASNPVISQQQRDAELLRKYLRDGDQLAGPSDRPSSIAALGTLKMIGIFIDGLGLFAIVLLLSGLIDLAEQQILIPQPVLIAAGLWMTIVIGINVVAVAGIFSGRPWGWFAASYSYCFWVFGSCGSVLVGLFSGNVSQVCSNVFYVPFAIWALTRFTPDDAIKYFKLKMNPWAGIGIVFGAAFLTWVLFAVCLFVFGVLAAMTMKPDA